MDEDDLEAKPTPRRTGSPSAKATIQAAAHRKLAVVEARGGQPDFGYNEREAAKLDLPARKRLTKLENQGVGVGGELMLHMPLAPGDLIGMELRDTVKDPNMITASAQVDRLRLTEEAGALDIALDATDTIQPQNSFEKMLAHQLSALHVLAMRQMGKAERWCDFASPDNEYNDNQAANVEAARCTNAAAKAAQVFQQGLLTLQRLRCGGKQQVNVVHQYVQVNDGGQAAVAQTVDTSLTPS